MKLRDRERWLDKFAYLGAAASLLFLAALVLSGCGLRPDGSYAPETLISADTPCGHVDYHSTKDQANPAYQCTIGRDGEKSLTVGSDNAVGAGLIAQSVANGVVSGLAIVKAP